MLMVHHYMEDHPDYDREPFVPTVSGSIEGVDPPERPASPVKLEPPPIERQKACIERQKPCKMPKLVGPASYGGPDPGDPFLDNLPLIVAAVGLAFVVGMWANELISKPVSVAACCE